MVKWLSQVQIEEFRVCKRVLWIMDNRKIKDALNILTEEQIELIKNDYI